ncbi:hypothetical protein KUTeg_015026, partial [Tegillarca granosa]
MNLQPVEEDDYKDLSPNRRTIVGTDGSDLPDVSSIVDIMVYLLTACQWDTKHLVDESCKHCLAVLFDRGIEVGTDKQCQWDKPRQTSNPTEVTTLQFKKKGMYVMSIGLFQLTIDNVRLPLIQACKEYGSVLLHTLDYSSDEDEVDVGVFQKFQEILQNAPIDLNDEELIAVVGKSRFLLEGSTLLLVQLQMQWLNVSVVVKALYKLNVHSHFKTKLQLIFMYILKMV